MASIDIPFDAFFQQLPTVLEELSRMSLSGKPGVPAETMHAQLMNLGHAASGFASFLEPQGPRSLAGPEARNSYPAFFTNVRIATGNPPVMHAMHMDDEQAKQFIRR